MPNKRDVSLGKYGISRWRYRELCYFCRQYQEKKDELRSLTSIKAINYSYSSGTNGRVSSSTEEAAIKILGLKKDIELIEQSAIEADSSIYEYILLNVTEEIPYEYMPVPCGRRQFYNLRRKFFYILSKKK